MDDLLNGAGLPPEEPSAMLELAIVSNIEFNGMVITEDGDGNRYLVDIENPNAVEGIVSIERDTLFTFDGVPEWVFSAVNPERRAEAKKYLDQYGYYTLKDLEDVFPQYSRVFSGVVNDIPSMINIMIGTKE